MQRDLGTLWSLKVNNFFLFVALLVYGALQSGVPPRSAYPFFVLLGLLLLFPASSDPLDKIPPERLQTWPLETRHRLALRLLSLALSPVFWLAVLFDARFVLLLLFPAALSFLPATHRKWDQRFAVPPLFPAAFPRTQLTLLITNHLREMFTLLDTWLAILISLVGIAWRISRPNPDPESLPILGMLVALALSTHAQSLFGLDFESAETRYRLLPLPSWKILLTKDLAYLGLLLLLTIPLSPMPALTFGLVSLTIGHYSSLKLRLPQRRWRFTAGRLLPVGAFQVLAGVALGFLELRRGPLVFATVCAAYLLSLNFFTPARVS